MIYQGQKQYPVREVVLHCAAIKTGQFYNWSPFQVFSEINRWHKQRGFVNGFGYHALIMPDGFVVNGRPYSQIGAHVLEANRGTLGFLMIESREIKLPKGYRLEDCKADMWFKPVQLLAVRDLIQMVPGIERVCGHNDYAPKLCPGFKVKSSDWLA